MIKIANAPCSWGVLEFDLEGEAAGYEQVLNEIKGTGYIGTELGDYGFMPTNPKILSKELQTRQLELLGAFVPINFSEQKDWEKGIDYMLKVAHLMKDAGYPNAFIVLSDENGKNPIRSKNAGRISAQMQLNNEQWQIFADGVNYAAETLWKTLNMKAVFHHHCAGYIETEDEIDKLMELTNPETVGLCFDSGHVKFGGGNPLKVLEKHWDRVWHVHFKDCSNAIHKRSRDNEWDYFESVKNGIFCELGKGDVNFKEIWHFLEEKNYNGWVVVEQDVLPGMGSPKQCAKNNLDFIRGLEKIFIN